MSQQPGKKLTYRDAGLDLALYEQSLANMVPFIKRTHTPRVFDGFGGFASHESPGNPKSVRQLQRDRRRR
jgi:phosphoribosylaminoimidazole (AIR) synthetase